MVLVGVEAGGLEMGRRMHRHRVVEFVDLNPGLAQLSRSARDPIALLDAKRGEPRYARGGRQEGCMAINVGRRIGHVDHVGIADGTGGFRSLDRRPMVLP